MFYFPSAEPIGPVYRRFFRAVTMEETKKPELVTAIRWTCFTVTRRQHLTDTSWFPHIIDGYENLKVTILDNKGRPVWLNTETFEATERQILTGKYPAVAAARRAFFFYNCCIPPHPNGGSVRPKSRVQFAVMSSIVGAMYPELSRHWPRRGTFGGFLDTQPPANDNRKPRTR